MENAEIQECEKVPMWVSLSNVSSGAVVLYPILMMASAYENNGNPYAACSPPRKALAEMMQANVKSVTRWTKELESLGAITIKKAITGTGKVNVYTPNMNPPENYAGFMSLEDFYKDRPDTSHDQVDCDIMQSTGELCPNCRWIIERA